MDGGFVRIGREKRRCVRCKKIKMSGMLQLHKGYVVGTFCRQCFEKDRLLEGWKRPNRGAARDRG